MPRKYLGSGDIVQPFVIPAGEINDLHAKQTIRISVLVMEEGEVTK
jgi:hypothetical protein